MYPYIVKYKTIFEISFCKYLSCASLGSFYTFCLELAHLYGTIFCRAEYIYIYMYIYVYLYHVAYIYQIMYVFYKYFPLYKVNVLQILLILL